MRITVYSSIILGFSIIGASAQDICSGILSYAGRDLTSEVRLNTIAADLFTQHCEGASAKKGSNTSIGLEAVVKAIPIKFNFGGSSNEEKLNNFCKTYDSRRDEFYSEVIDTSRVVRESLDAFNQCIQLSARDIFFNPTIGRTSLLIEVRRGSDDASITGVTYDAELLTCRLPPKTPVGSGTTSKAEIANSDTLRSLDVKSLPLICDRLPRNAPDGAKLYPRAELIVSTNRGSFFLPVARDAELPEQWATDLNNKIAQLQLSQMDLANRVDAIDKRLKVVAIAEIKGAALVYGSEGVSYSDGVLSFPNPSGLRIVPVISDSKAATYITSTHWIPKIDLQAITVREKALDTAGAERTSAPSDFTAVIVGF